MTIQEGYPQSMRMKRKEPPLIQDVNKEEKNPLIEEA